MTKYPAPRRISQPAPHELKFTWPDSSECVLPLQRLRDECPCAGCKGETILGKHYAPLQRPTITPGMYELTRVTPVGNYALQFVWKDGHDSGIYTWEYLHLLCGAE
jgi:DUF971 family protein